MPDNCDFCSQRLATRHYDAGQDILVRMFVESGPEVGPAHNYTRVWAACERCSEFIDRGDIAGLKALVFSLWNESPEFVALMADPDGRALAKQMLDTSTPAAVIVAAIAVVSSVEPLPVAPYALTL